MKDSSLMKIPFRWVVKHEERVIDMEKRRVEVYLTDEQFHFLQWLVYPFPRFFKKDSKRNNENQL